MTMRPYVVPQGDYLTRLAHRMGFDADAVWSHDANRALCERRPNRELLHPGDVLHVPAPERRQGLALTPHQENRYRARIPRVGVSLTLRDAANQPFANKPYRVLGMGPSAHEGTTDVDGALSFSVPVSVREVRLILDGGVREYRLMIGHMDPVEELSGARKRLEHLGFLKQGAVRDDGTYGNEDAALRGALRMFQATQKITVSGDLDQATRDALVRMHGS